MWRMQVGRIALVLISYVMNHFTVLFLLFWQWCLLILLDTAVIISLVDYLVLSFFTKQISIFLLFLRYLMQARDKEKKTLNILLHRERNWARCWKWLNLVWKKSCWHVLNKRISAKYLLILFNEELVIVWLCFGVLWLCILFSPLNTTQFPFFNITQKIVQTF